MSVQNSAIWRKMTNEQDYKKKKAVFSDRLF